MALIICKKCGHTVSDKATECPSCGSPIRNHCRSIQDVLSGKWGKYFLLSSILLLANAIAGIVLNRLSSQIDEHAWLFLSPMLIVVYYVATISINYVLGMTCKSRSKQVSAVSMCILAFIFRIVVFIVLANGIINELLILRPLIYLLLFTSFLIVVFSLRGMVKYAVLLLLVTYLLDEVQLFLPLFQFQQDFYVCYAYVCYALQAIASILFICIAIKHMRNSAKP